MTRHLKTVLLLWALSPNLALAAAGPLDHVTCSWLGNSFAGTGVNKWVQQDIEDLFVPYTGDSKDLGFATGHVEVFRVDTGARIGWMEPGPDIGRIGLQDIRECLSVHQRSSGEYVIFLEEDWKAKVLMFRWRP